MKFTDLREKKGPVIGAPKGSQKDSRLSPGTDDPSKYMRGGEWEAYREPQGVNSSAGKIAGGTKKGTTKTKNKKISEMEYKNIEQFADQGLAENPSRQYVDQLMQRAVQGGGTDPHLKGLYDPRGRFWIWDSEDENVYHMEVEAALIDRYDFPDFEDWMRIVAPDLEKEGVTREQAEEYFEQDGGYIPIIISPMDKQKGGIGQIWSGVPNALNAPEVKRALSESVRRILVAEGIGDTLRGMRDKMMGDPEMRKFKSDPDASLKNGNRMIHNISQLAREIEDEELENKLHDTRVSFARHMNNGEYQNAMSMMTHASNIRDKIMAAFPAYLRNHHATEGIQAGGPGVSGDLVPADRHATTIAMVKDTLDPNIKKSPKLAGSEAPTKFVKKQIKKSHDNRPGNVSDVTEQARDLQRQIDSIMNETIARVEPQDYSADYDLRDDKDQESIGVATITHGVIELLSVRDDIIDDYTGHIMTRLLSTIVRDADAANSNLAIALDDPDDLQQKRFLERFGFRGVGDGIMKRNAGSVTPPSVPTTRL